MTKIKILGTEISIINVESDDYTCITDIARYRDSERTDYVIQNWLRNRNTIELLGLWEHLNNPNFNPTEFDGFRKKAGLNSFVLTAKQWIQKTNAIGIISKSGRYGGTYVHKDIAFEFASWVSVEFKLYLIKEFQRLKEQEQKQLGWDIKRNLAKMIKMREIVSPRTKVRSFKETISQPRIFSMQNFALKLYVSKVTNEVTRSGVLNPNEIFCINYKIHTDAIKKKLIPKELTKNQINQIYASEADVLNVALFGMTAKEWRQNNKNKSGNIRDYADVSQLVCLSNLENLNALFINEGLAQNKRLIKLNEIAIQQMKLLTENENIKKLRKK